jgi:antitoxin component HigA of HigAB toxin-antitoxin module
MREQHTLNDAEHQSTLQRINRRMDARPGTQDARELGALAQVVESYVDRRFPIDDPGPLALFELRLEQLGIRFANRADRY